LAFLAVSSYPLYKVLNAWVHVETTETSICPIIIYTRGVVRGGATGAMAPPRFGWAMGHTHGTHPWPHLVLEAGPHLDQKPYYYLPGLLHFSIILVDTNSTSLSNLLSFFVKADVFAI